jgi:hypothetical protein
LNPPFFKLIGCEDQHTGSFAKLVDLRNDLAHSNGLINCRDQRSADQRIGEVMRQVCAIESEPCFEAMQDLFDEFLRLYPVEAEA